MASRRGVDPILAVMEASAQPTEAEIHGGNYLVHQYGVGCIFLLVLPVVREGFGPQHRWLAIATGATLDLPLRQG